VVWICIYIKKGEILDILDVAFQKMTRGHVVHKKKKNADDGCKEKKSNKEQASKERKKKNCMRKVRKKAIKQMQ